MRIMWHYYVADCSFTGMFRKTSNTSKLCITPYPRVDLVEYYVVQCYVVLRVGPRSKHNTFSEYLFSFDNLKMNNIHKVKNIFYMHWISCWFPNFNKKQTHIYQMQSEPVNCQQIRYWGPKDKTTQRFSEISTNIGVSSHANCIMLTEVPAKCNIS